MKQGIHPEYQLATVHCACGNTFQTRSTKEDIHLDVCSVCHPYFTGRQRLMDTAGRVERFRRKWSKSGASTEAADEETTEEPSATAAQAGAAEEPEETEAAGEETEARAEVEAEASAPEPEGEASEPEAEVEEESAEEEPAEEKES